MRVTYNVDVKRIMRAAGYTEAQIRTSEVKAAQEYNKDRARPAAAANLPERFSNVEDLQPVTPRD